MSRLRLARLSGERVQRLNMSQLLQGKTEAIPISGGEPPDSFWNGIPMNVDGTLAIDDEGPISFHHQGLPFTAQSRIATDPLGAVVSFNNGAMPLTAAGRLSTSAVGPAVAALAANGYLAAGNLIFGKI